MSVKIASLHVCEMGECELTPTHLGSNGWLYCWDHATMRRRFGYEQTRKLRPWEIRWINAGKRLPSYKPGSEPKEK